ncbi:hypothetical protein E4U21_006315 [Claviceps maximensis]|nr:hypothetical protein E4U21_006315 [Claviceps maximensis]
MAKKLNPLSFTNAVVRSFMADSGLEPRLLGAENFRIMGAEAGRVRFELDIHRNHLNRLNIIHGGTLACLVDLGGSLAVASTGRFATGVSTDLNVTYLAPGGKVGDVLRGTATCDKIGKTLAYTTVTFTNSRGQLAARGSHTKYVSGTLGEQGPFVVPAEFADVD